MVTIVDREPTMIEQLMGSLNQVAPQLTQALQGRKDADIIQRLTGENVRGASPELRRTLLEKHLAKKEEKQNLEQTYGTLIDEMEGLSDVVGPYRWEALNPYSELSGKRSQINTLRLTLEGLFRDLTLKGQFPKAIYERILKELPSADDTPEKYRNKIQAIRKTLAAHSGTSGQKAHEGTSERAKESSPGGKVTFVDPKTGKRYAIPHDKIEAARAKGLEEE